MNNGKDALTRLRDAVHLMWHRMDIVHEDNDPNPLFTPHRVEVTSDDLRGEATRLAEDIARLGRRFGVFVDIDADDETLASYGNSAVLRASWMAGREDYTSARDR